MSHVSINIGFVTSRIERGTLTPECINDLSEECSFEPAGSEFMRKSGQFKGKWDGKKRLYHKGHRTFGTGLLDRVCSILSRHGFSVDTTQEFITHVREAMPPMPLEWTLRPYQRKAVSTMLAQGGGMVKVATGGGKTVIAGHAIHQLGVETVFFVHTKDLLYQALESFRSMFGEEWVGQIGDGVCDPRFITVCTLQTAARALDVDYEVDSYAEGDESWRDKTTPTDGVRAMLFAVQCVFMDECHRVAAPTAMNVLTNTPNAPWRYGLSASPWRDDNADLALESIFGRIIVDINASELIRQGFLVAPVIRFRRVEPGRFTKKQKYAEIYKQYIVENDRRNELVVADACSKLQRGVPTLVLVREIAHGERLAEDLRRASGVDVPFLSGRDDSDTRNSVIRSLRDCRLSALIATTIADEGLDIKPLSGLVLAGGGKSSTRALQRVGRTLRTFPGKQRAEITDFEDNARFLLEHSNARMKIYQTEPEFQIVDF